MYEETIAYFVLFQIDALASLVLYKVTGRRRYLCLVGISAGIGLLVRPTGLVYVAVYGAVIWSRRYKKDILRYALACAPFVVFFMQLNMYRTGTPFGLGINNTNPHFDWDYQQVRFGSTCARDAVATNLLSNLFVVSKANTPALDRCGFSVESSCEAVSGCSRENVFSPPFIAWGFSALLMLCVWYLARTRSYRLDGLAPLVGITFLFVAYVYAGIGFTYRYADDFLPLYALLFVLVGLGAASQVSNRQMIACVFALAAVIGIELKAKVAPQLPSILKGQTPLIAEKVEPLFGEIPLVHWNRYNVAALPRSRSCRDGPLDLPHDKYGWRFSCAAGPVVNLFMSLPVDEPARAHFTLLLELANAVPDRVYINGRSYPASSEGISLGNQLARKPGSVAEYRVDFSADLRHMLTPNVLVSLSYSEQSPLVHPYLYRVAIEGG